MKLLLVVGESGDYFGGVFKKEGGKKRFILVEGWGNCKKTPALHLPHSALVRASVNGSYASYASEKDVQYIDVQRKSLLLYS